MRANGEELIHPNTSQASFPLPLQEDADKTMGHLPTFLQQAPTTHPSEEVPLGV